MHYRPDLYIFSRVDILYVSIVLDILYEVCGLVLYINDIPLPNVDPANPIADLSTLSDGFHENILN